MDKRKKMLPHIVLFVLFWGIVIAPYWVETINRVTPTILGVPFLICYYVFFTVLGCLNLYFMNKNVTENYEEEPCAELEVNKADGMAHVVV